VAEQRGGWLSRGMDRVAKLVAQLLATTTLFARIKTSLKNHFKFVSLALQKKIYGKKLDEIYLLLL
jgi:hypothetical protein